MDKPIDGAVTMDAPQNSPMLTREQVDAVIEGMSAADLVDAMAVFPDNSQSLQMAMAAFDSAGQRLGYSNGARPSQHVKVGDLKYLGEKIKGAINIDSPLSEGQEA